MPSPPKSGIFLFALVALLTAACHRRPLLAEEGSPQNEPHRSVKALRYTILWGESALEITHGGGQWVQEIFFPEKNVACTLVFQYPELEEMTKEGGAKLRARLYAFSANGPRNHLTGFKDPKPSAIEKVEVPTDVAKEIFLLAELTMRQERETWRLGRKLASQGLMRELPRPDAPESK